MSTLTRRQMVAVALSAAFPTLARAQTYPARPVRLIVPFGPGGPSDVMARVIGTQLQSAWGQPFVVENRVGAGGGLGADAVAKSPPDGHTLLMGTIGTQVLNKSIFSNLTYNPDTQLRPVAFVSDAEGILVVNTALPVSNATELIALARKAPDSLSFGSGAGLFIANNTAPERT